MPKRLTRSDDLLLELLAEYRLLTTCQIAALLRIGVAAARKRTRNLREAGMAGSMSRLLAPAQPGRPKELMSITARGVAHLQTLGRLPGSTPAVDVTGDRVRCVEHHLLVNWVRIGLNLTREAQARLAAYDYQRVPGLLNEAAKLQEHGERLLKLIERSEAKLLHAIKRVAKQHREVSGA